MVFIKDFIESLHHSLFDLDQLKVDILTCSLCPRVKMLFMSRFTSPFIEPLCPLRYTTVQLLGFNSILPLPSGTGGREEEGRDSEEGERRMRSGECIPLWSQKKSPKHFQACITGSCGTSVIKAWMRRRGHRLQSISYRSLGPSLLIDWSPGAVAPFCKVHYVITLRQQQKNFNKHKIILIHPQATPGPRRFPEESIVKCLNKFFLNRNNVLICHSGYYL